MTEPKRVSVFLICLIAFFIIMLVAPAWAGGDRITQSNDQNLQTTGNVNTGGNNAYGFGRSSFDVDLNQCMGSTSWDTILVGRQKLVLNKWCAAESFDARGLHLMAAIMRCDIPEIAKHFTDGCIEANTMRPVHPEPPPMADVDDGEDERIDSLYARLSDLEAQRQSDADKVQKAAQRPPEIIQRTVIEQTPFLTAEKRAKLQAVLDE